MEYRLDINEDTVPFAVDIETENRFKASTDKKSFDVCYNAISEHQIHITINGQGINAYLVDDPEGKQVVINGKPYLVKDADAMEQVRHCKRGDNTEPGVVTPPMPAVVVAVLIGEGELVKKGDSLVVLSAMKMETTLTAPYTGTVSAVRAIEGDNVKPGDILVDIEKSDE